MDERSATLEEPVVAVPTAPYRGIRPFRYVDHPIFFAREDEAEDLLRLVLVYRGVLLYGDSGSGKSSLINAGLLPAAKSRGFQPERIRVQPRPGEELVVERIRLTDEREKDFLPSLFTAEDEPTPFSTATFEERLRAGCESGRPLLVFDQFEELVTLFGEAGECDLQRGVVDLVVALLRDERLPVKLLFAFREDYLASVKHLLAEVPELVDQALRLSAPSADELMTIIRGPFELDDDEFPVHFEREISPELAEHLRERLADRFGSGEVSLSEVQTVCLRLWLSEDPKALLDERDVQGILEDYLGEELDAFPPDLKYPAVALLGQMVTAQGTRNVLPAETLVEKVRDEEDIPPEQLERALKRLESKSKLVRSERRLNLYLYELTSEFLVPWISRRREELVRLRDRRRERRRLLVFGSAIGLILVVTVVGVLATWALVQRSQAKRAARSATALVLAIASNEQRANNPDVSLLMGLEAVHAESSADPRSSMIAALIADRRGGAGVIGAVHTDAVSSVAFSPDGGTLASGSLDGTVGLLDLRTREPLGVLEGNANPVVSVAFSADGATLASADSGGMVQLWDFRNRTRRGLPLRGHSGPVASVAFSPDGETLASASYDGTLRVWDVATQTPLGEPLRGHTDAVNAVAFSPDGETLASAGLDGTVRLWDVAEQESLGEPLLGHTGAVSSVAFSPDGETLASAGQDGTLRLWDVETHTPLGEPLPSRIGSDPILGVAFSPDGETLASAGIDGTVELWDVRSRTRRGAPLRGHKGAVFDVAFSPEGETLATAGGDGTVRLWDVAAHTPLSQPLSGHTDAVNAVAFSPDGETLASASLDGTVRLWDVAAHSPFGQPLSGHTDAVNAVAFSPDGETLASASLDGTVRLWDVSAHSPFGQPLSGHTDAVNAVAFSPDGETLASASLDGTVRLWDVAEQESLDGPLLGHTGAVSSVAFGPDGETLASTGEDGTLRLWDVETHKPLGEPLPSRIGSTPILGVAFSSDGETLASAGLDGTVRLWDVAEQESLGEPLLGHTGAVSSVAFGPDGETLASTGEDGTLRLWDVETHKPLGEPLPSRIGSTPILGVAFSSDGETLASAGIDRKVRLWEGFLWRNFDDLRITVCGIVDVALTKTEWEELAHGIEYRSSCS